MMSKNFNKKYNTIRIDSNEKKIVDTNQLSISNTIDISVKSKTIKELSTTYYKSDDNNFIKDESSSPLNLNIKTRKDFKGNPILKGKKKNHHISFRDVSHKKPIADYIDIQAFKIEIEDEICIDTIQNENISCSCIAF